MKHKKNKDYLYDKILPRLTKLKRGLTCNNRIAIFIDVQEDSVNVVLSAHGFYEHIRKGMKDTLLCTFSVEEEDDCLEERYCDIVHFINFYKEKLEL